MIIVLDIGNTLLKIGLFEEDKLVDNFKMRVKTFEELTKFSLFLNGKVSKDKVEGAIISSVVPSLTKDIKGIVDKLFDINTLVVNHEFKTNFTCKIDNPKELGSDFISSAVGAIHEYGTPILVSDLGTASKICVVNKTSEFIGGMIAPGMKTSLEGLINNAEMLNDTILELPQNVVGSNTITCIQSGIIYGQAFMIKMFGERIDKELGYECKKVLTGGFSEIIKNEVKDYIYDPNIVLKGLKVLYDLNK